MYERGARRTVDARHSTSGWVPRRDHILHAVAAGVDMQTRNGRGAHDGAADDSCSYNARREAGSNGLKVRFRSGNAVVSSHST